jgi:uncharacterized protein (DUF433 family)
MRHWENLDAIEREPSKMSGAWVFRKTRVPVSALFENLRDGATVEDFLEWFPPVQRSQVEAVLDYELDLLAVAVVLSMRLNLAIMLKFSSNFYCNNCSKFFIQIAHSPYF